MRKTVVTMIDDTDGSEATETVTFSLDGQAYEIDLSGENAAKLRAALAPFREKATRPTTLRTMNGRGARRPGQRTGSDRDKSADIRAWAAEQGIKVNDRGRIPAAVTQQYETAMAAPKPAAKATVKATAKPAAKATAKPAVVNPVASEPAAAEPAPVKKTRAPRKPRKEVPDTVFTDA